MNEYLLYLTKDPFYYFFMREYQYEIQLILVHLFDELLKFADHGRDQSQAIQDSNLKIFKIKMIQKTFFQIE